MRSWREHEFNKKLTRYATFQNIYIILAYRLIKNILKSTHTFDPQLIRIVDHSAFGIFCIDNDFLQILMA